MEKAETLIIKLDVLWSSDMLKNSCFLGVVLSLFSMTSVATQHYNVAVPKSLSGAKTPTVATQNISSFLVTSILDSGDELGVLWYKRQGQGFTPSSFRQIKVSGLGPLSGSVAYSVAGTTTDIYGGYVLTKGEMCAQCGSDKYVLSVHGMSGDLDLRRHNQGFVEPNVGQCGAEPMLLQAAEGVMFFDGCTTLRKYSPVLQLLSESTIEPVTNREWGRQPWVVRDDSGGQVIGKVHTWGGYTEFDGEYWRWHSTSYDENANAESFGSVLLPSEPQRCKWLMGASSPQVACLISGKILVSDIGVASSGFVELDLKKGLLDSAGLDLQYKDNFSGFSTNGHVFMGHQVFLTEVADVITTSKTSTQWRVGNYRPQDGQRYALHTNAVSSNEHSDVELDGTSYQIEPGGYFAVSAIKGDDGVNRLSVYDHLTVISPVEILRGLGGSFQSNTTFEQSFLYQDEEALYGDVVITGKDLPNWAEIVLVDDMKNIKLFPYHGDVGDWVFEFAFENSVGETRALSGAYSVALQDYRLDFFEPKLFERIEQSNPLPLSLIVSALKRINVFEDELFNADFSFLNREIGEVELTIDGLPAFLSWDGTANKLQGTPLQRDVGDYEINLSAKDSFVGGDGNHTKTIKIPIRVIQIDEPLKIVSSPLLMASVSAEYKYSLVVEDEETGTHDLRVALLSLPTWLTYDSENMILSGTPTQKDIGSNLVQFVVQDDGGYSVMQSYTLTVSASAENDTGSSGGVLGPLGLFLLALSLLTRLIRPI
jgi:hypothetical protein